MGRRKKIIVLKDCTSDLHYSVQRYMFKSIFLSFDSKTFFARSGYTRYFFIDMYADYTFSGTIYRTRRFFFVFDRLGMSVVNFTTAMIFIGERMIFFKNIHAHALAKYNGWLAPYKDRNISLVTNKVVFNFFLKKKILLKSPFIIFGLHFRSIIIVCNLYIEKHAFSC